MIRRLRREQPRLTAVEAHAVEMREVWVSRLLAERGEVDDVAGRVDVLDGAHHPRTMCDPSFECARRAIVEIEVIPPVALRAPDDLGAAAYRFDDARGIDVEVRFQRLLHNDARRAGDGVDHVQALRRVTADGTNDADAPAILVPRAEQGTVVVLNERLHVYRNPAPTIGLEDDELLRRKDGVAGERIDVRVAARPDVAGWSVLRHRQAPGVPCVHAEGEQPLGIRRPRHRRRKAWRVGALANHNAGIHHARGICVISNAVGGRSVRVSVERTNRLKSRTKATQRPSVERPSGMESARDAAQR